MKVTTQDREWLDYPNGTKAYSYTGGHWVKVPSGWQWFCGSTFPTPGADWREIEEPLTGSTT